MVMDNSIKNIFSVYNRNEEVIKFSKLVAEDGASEDDIERWRLNRIDNYKYDYQVSTYYNGELSALLFYKWYGNFLRINIGQYLLKKNKKYLHRWPFYPNGGCFKLIQENVKKPLGYFGTFYTKNKKLSSLVKMLKSNKHRGLSRPKTEWDNFAIYQNEPITFRYVPQWIMYYNQKGDLNNNLKTLYNILENDR